MPYRRMHNASGGYKMGHECGPHKGIGLKKADRKHAANMQRAYAMEGG